MLVWESLFNNLSVVFSIAQTAANVGFANVGTRCAGILRKLNGTPHSSLWWLWPISSSKSASVLSLSIRRGNDKPLLSACLWEYWPMTCRRGWVFLSM